MAQLPVITEPASTCEALLEQYNTGVSQVPDKHAQWYLSQWFFALCLLGSMMRSLRREEFTEEHKEDGECVS